LEYQIEALANVGVTEIVLAIAYQPEHMLSHIDYFEKKVNLIILV
jgi:NDP-sugar pyrophosphorylase family protein